MSKMSKTKLMPAWMNKTTISQLFIIKNQKQ